MREVGAQAAASVLQPGDGPLVAGYHPRGKDDGVALLQRDVGVLPLAILASAARGSPWPPVQTIRLRSRGR